jgi:hypothetical protein
LEQPQPAVEILSRSTQNHGIIAKLAFYRLFLSVDEILLVRFDQRRCELWRRAGETCSVRDWIGSAGLPLRTTTVPVLLNEPSGPLGTIEASPEAICGLWRAISPSSSSPPACRSGRRSGGAPSARRPVAQRITCSRVIPGRSV